MGQSQTKKMMNKNKKDSKFESKEKYFIQNGAILLQKQIALSQGQDIGSGQLKVFSIKDIDKATNYYDTDLIVGSVRATVYKGTLDDRIVAIKLKETREHELNPELINLFLTEASTGTVMNHDNMVRLHGCCLETYIPILVYEFLPNGSLFEHLHGGVTFSKTLQWDDRLRVASHISYALSYMHNALSKPVVHRDVQSINVLLDYSFNAKLSNFGYSVSVTPGDTSQRWPVEGSPGYIDPEYMETGEVTDKCDVYSFGVLMLELLTGRQPRMMARAGIDLVDVFVSAAGNNCMKRGDR